MKPMTGPVQVKSIQGQEQAAGPSLSPSNLPQALTFIGGNESLSFCHSVSPLLCLCVGSLCPSWPPFSPSLAPALEGRVFLRRWVCWTTSIEEVSVGGRSERRHVDEDGAERRKRQRRSDGPGRGNGGGGREDLLIPHLSCACDAIQPLRYRMMISCFHVAPLWFVAQ